MKRKLKRMGIQTLTVALCATLFMGVGRTNDWFYEKIRTTLSTSTDIKWVIEKTKETGEWIKNLGESHD